MIEVDGTEYPRRVEFRVRPMQHPNDFMNLEVFMIEAPRKMRTTRWEPERWTKPVYLVRLVGSRSWFTRHHTFSAAYAAAWRRSTRFDADTITQRRRAKRSAARKAVA